MYYRGFYRGAPFCRFGFGSLFLLGGAFILGSIVAEIAHPGLEDSITEMSMSRLC